MEQNQYPRIFKSVGWITLISFILFFALINFVVWLFFKDRVTVGKRFHSPVSYAEIINKIELVKKDKNKKIIFFGSSPMAGAAGSYSDEDVIPFQFAKNVHSGVSVYDFAYSGGRPFDELIIATLLKDQADLFVFEINATLLRNDMIEGAKEDRTKYLRVQNLLSANYRTIFKENPDVEQCLKSYNLTPPHELFFDISGYVPLIKHKDEVNYLLFGKPFPLFFGSAITGVLELFKHGDKQIVWGEIFKPAKLLPFVKNNVKAIEGPVQLLESSISSCIVKALAVYSAKNNVPAVFYLSPHSPEWTRLQRPQRQYAENNNFMLSLVQGVESVDLDTAQTIPAEDFADPDHFNPDGHKKVADALYDFIKNIDAYKKLVK